MIASLTLLVRETTLLLQSNTPREIYFYVFDTGFWSTSRSLVLYLAVTQSCFLVDVSYVPSKCCEETGYSYQMIKCLAIFTTFKSNSINTNSVQYTRWKYDLDLDEILGINSPVACFSAAFHIPSTYKASHSNDYISTLF